MSSVARPPDRPIRGAGTRERILDAACELIAQAGIDDVRIARIAQVAGVSTALVHYHFDTRDALLAEALLHSFERAGDGRIGTEPADAEPTDVARRLGAMIDQCLPFPGLAERDWVLWVELWLRAVRNPDLRPVAAELYRRYRTWFAQTIAEGIERAQLDAGIDAEAVADTTLALLDGLGLRTLLGDPAMPIDAARDHVRAVLARELGIPVGRLHFAPGRG